MLFKGTFGDQYSGSAGGLTASHNRGGYYLRQRVVPANPSSLAQLQRRAAFRTAINRWMDLSQVNRESWATWAANVPFTNRLGDARPITGQNAYVGSRVLRQQAGLTAVSAGPATFNRGNMGDVAIESIDGTSDDFDIAFDATASWATAVGGALLVFQGKPQPASVEFYKGPFLFNQAILGAVVAPTSPDTMASLYPLAAGQRVFVRVVAVQADGRYSAGQVLSGIAS